MKLDEGMEDEGRTAEDKTVRVRHSLLTLALSE